MLNSSNKIAVKDIIFLHIILLLYSGSSICSKLAASQEFLSLPFVLLYGCVVLCLMIFAVLWQQILKKMPLTVAYANKSVVIIWGMIAGSLFFQEKITWPIILGSVIIVIGVYLVVREDG